MVQLLTFFSLFLALKMLFCSQTHELLEEMKEGTLLSYSGICKKPRIENWSCRWCNLLKEFGNFSQPYVGVESNWGTRFNSIVKNDDTLIIIFRGTEMCFGKPGCKAIYEWFLDFDFIPKHLEFAPKEVKVHEGFLRAYHLHQDEIMQLVNDRLEKTKSIKNIYFSSHSLGGAISQLCILNLTLSSNPLLKRVKDNNGFKIFTIGSPRVGNKEFAKFFKANLKNSKRLVNQRDAAPAVPPQSFGYHHVANEYWFENNSEEFRKCDGSGEDPSCSVSVPLWRRNVKYHTLYLGYDQDDGC